MDDNGTQVNDNDCALSEPISPRNLPRSNEEALVRRFSTCMKANYVSFVARKFVLSGHAGVRDTLTSLRLKRLRRKEGQRRIASDPCNGTSISLNEFNTRGSRFDATINVFLGNWNNEKMIMAIQLRMSVTRPIRVLLRALSL